MAMKPFVDSEVVRSRIGMMEHDAVTGTLEGAIIGAQIYFEEVLQTRLMRQTNSDKFNLDPNLIYIVPNGFYRLRLKNGLVREDTPVVVTKYDTYMDVAMSNGGYVLDSTRGDYFVDNSKGIVHINHAAQVFVDPFHSHYGSSRHSRRSAFFKVTYSSGFDGAKDAPDWLKEAIYAYIPSLVNQTQTFNRNAESKDLYEVGKKHTFTLLEPYLRDIGFCFRVIG